MYVVLTLPLMFSPVEKSAFLSIRGIVEQDAAPLVPSVGLLLLGERVGPGLHWRWGDWIMAGNGTRGIVLSQDVVEVSMTLNMSANATHSNF